MCFLYLLIPFAIDVCLLMSIDLCLLFWYGFGMVWYGFGMVLVLCWYCVSTVCYCFGMVLAWFWYCLVWFWYGFGIVVIFVSKTCDAAARSTGGSITSFSSYLRGASRLPGKFLGSFS